MTFVPKHLTRFEMSYYTMPRTHLKQVGEYVHIPTSEGEMYNVSYGWLLLLNPVILAILSLDQFSFKNRLTLASLNNLFKIAPRKILALNNAFLNFMVVKGPPLILRQLHFIEWNFCWIIFIIEIPYGHIC